MSSPAITIGKDASLVEAIDAIKRNEVSRLIVLQDDRIVGVVTEKDIVRELGSVHAYRLPPSRIYVSGMMTSNPITVAPDVTARRAAELMLDHDISGLPVVEEGKLVGVVTKLDFAKVCANYDDIYVGQVMRASPLTVSPGERVIHVRRLLLEGGLLATPVMEGRELVGIVTMRDVLMKLMAFQEAVPDQYKSERIRNLLVGEVMTRSPVTARTDETLPGAAKVMLERRFSGLPVVNLEGELVGLLTKTELTEVARERL
jgi:CBS domain-containing protein